MNLAGRLFAWPPRLAGAAGLWWGGLLNTAPATTVLMEEGHSGFAGKPRPGEIPMVGHGDNVDNVDMPSLMKIGRSKGLDFSSRVWGFKPVFLDIGASGNIVRTMTAQPTPCVSLFRERSDDLPTISSRAPRWSWGTTA